MSNNTAAEARRRRAEKIKAGAAGRLAKITGRPVEPQLTEETLVSTQKPTDMGEHEGEGPANDSQSPEQSDFSEDPLFRLLQEIQKDGDDHAIRNQAAPLEDLFGLISGGGNSQFAANLKSAMGSRGAKLAKSGGAEPGSDANGLGSNFIATQSDMEPAMSSKERGFLVARSLLMLFASAYVTVFPQRLWYAFITAELFLITARFMGGLAPKIPLLQTIAPQLPQKYQTRVHTAMIAYGSLQNAWQDLLIVLFIYGLANVHQGTSPNSLYFRP